MSAEFDRIIDQLTREFDGDPWHGPSLKAVLNGVTASQAAAKPSPGAHSIWELVLHMTGWKREVASRLRGAEAGEPAAGDWPAVGEPSQARWRAAKDDLARAQTELLDALRALPPARLHRPVRDVRDRRLGTGMTVYQTIYGLIQHDAYHSGQAALVKKLVTINDLRV
jgi:uncharacterized damage-inducible protein DinB